MARLIRRWQAKSKGTEVCSAYHHRTSLCGVVYCNYLILLIFYFPLGSARVFKAYTQGGTREYFTRARIALDQSRRDAGFVDELAHDGAEIEC